MYLHIYIYIYLHICIYVTMYRHIDICIQIGVSKKMAITRVPQMDDLDRRENPTEIYFGVHLF